jgi:hypothetical protein
MSCRESNDRIVCAGSTRFRWVEVPPDPVPRVDIQQVGVSLTGSAGRTLAKASPDNPGNSSPCATIHRFDDPRFVFFTR